jgi:hypothetical protein
MRFFVSISSKSVLKMTRFGIGSNIASFTAEIGRSEAIEERQRLLK